MAYIQPRRPSHGHELLRRLQHHIQRDDGEAVATGRAFERLMVRIQASGDSSASRVRHPGQAFAWTRLGLAASVAAAALPLTAPFAGVMTPERLAVDDTPGFSSPSSSSSLTFSLAIDAFMRFLAFFLAFFSGTT